MLRVSSRRSDAVSNTTASIIKSVVGQHQHQLAREALEEKRIPLRLATGSFRHLAFGAYEKLTGDDKGTIWKKVQLKTEAGVEDWLVYDQDDSGEIIRSLAADNSDSIKPMTWTVDQSKQVTPEGSEEDQNIPDEDTDEESSDLNSDLVKDLIHITVDPKNKKVNVEFGGKEGEEDQDQGKEEEEAPQPDENQIQQNQPNTKAPQQPAPAAQPAPTGGPAGGKPPKPSQPTTPSSLVNF